MFIETLVLLLAGVFTVLLVAFLFWTITGERPFFRRRTIGEDMKSAEPDMSDSLRDAVR